MEHLLKIPVAPKFNVVGRLRGNPQKQPLVIFLHGLGSNMDHHLFFNGARFFEKKSFASFRFNFYGGGKGVRHMKQGSLATQAADLQAILKYFKKQKAKKIFLVGHSYGALTIMVYTTILNAELGAGVSLWDASFDPYNNEFAGMEYVPAVKGYVFTRAFDVILGKRMVEEAKKLDCVTLGKKIRRPFQIIVSEKSKVLFGNELYFQNARGSKEFAVMKGAGHNFHEDGLEEKLFKKTYEWFKKCA